jgi:predicted outer membrane protein
LKRQRISIEPIQPEPFIAAAMKECMIDAELAQMASAQATSDVVRNFALQLVDDCKKTLLDISRIATRKNLPLPDSLDVESEQVLQNMREKTDTDFDSAYMQRLALHHRRVLTLFKRGQTIKNPEISALASRLLAMAEARIKLSRHFSVSVDQLLDAPTPIPAQSSTDFGQTRL